MTFLLNKHDLKCYVTLCRTMLCSSQISSTRANVMQWPELCFWGQSFISGVCVAWTSVQVLIYPCLSLTLPFPTHRHTHISFPCCLSLISVQKSLIDKDRWDMLAWKLKRRMKPAPPVCLFFQMIVSEPSRTLMIDSPSLKQIMTTIRCIYFTDQEVVI